MNLKILEKIQTYYTYRLGKNFEVKNIEAQKHWAFKTVAEVSKSLYDKICLDDGTEQNTVDLKRNEKVNFTEDEERFFTEFKKY